jgi:hypothetical protein
MADLRGECLGEVALDPTQVPPQSHVPGALVGGNIQNDKRHILRHEKQLDSDIDPSDGG